MEKMPLFKEIKLEDIPPASAAQFLGGTKITEFYGNKRYKFPYKPAPFHTAFIAEDGLTLNIGKFKTITPLAEGFKSSRRIDVIIYRDLTDEQRKRMSRHAMTDADRPKWGFNWPTYGLRDFLRFEPLLRWLPKDSRDFCSEDTTLRFRNEGVKISYQEPQRTAPWDVYVWAFNHPESCEVRTLWVGEDFAKKYG